MSKNNRKKGKVRFDAHSDNDSVNDMASVYSNNSYDDEYQNDDSQSVQSVEKFEDKLLQAIENATEKSAQTRTQSLQSICETLQHRFIPDFIDDRKITVMDIAEKSLRRGKGAEQEWAARLAPLLVIQLGGDDDISSTLSQDLQTVIQNKVNSYSVRAWSCTSLALLHFLNGNDIANVVEAMQHFEQIFAGSYLKGDKTAPNVGDDTAQLHVAALSAWGLLATLIPPGDFCSYINTGNLAPSMANLIGLLQSTHVEVRMACGELIAIILECGRIHDEEFLEDFIPDLIDTTTELAKDSQKFRAKKDRKAQRASFRDVLRYLEEDITPEFTVRFGKESLGIDSWSTNIQYQKLCELIGPGITTHLTENDFLRDILDLGAKISQPNGAPTHKQTKYEQKLVNAAAFKARTLSLKKNRDKRSAVF